MSSELVKQMLRFQNVSGGASTGPVVWYQTQKCACQFVNQRYAAFTLLMLTVGKQVIDD
jgi:hypothetical protein